MDYVQEDDVNLFDSSLLYSLDFSQCVSSFDPTVMPERPGDGLVMRSLQIGDYDKGIVQKHLDLVGYSY